MVYHAAETAPDAPDLAPVREVVSDRIWRALIDASAKLTELGVHHALIGGLAVGALGYPRSTKDVDFIVDNSGWEETPAGLVIMRVAMPIRAHGIDIDTLAIPRGHEHLASAIENATITEGVPVAPVEEIVYLKLLTPRTRDLEDIGQLLERGVFDAADFEAYLNEVKAPNAVRNRWRVALRRVGQ